MAHADLLLPARPSTQRVFVWRKLKTAGVLYLQHSVCLLPDDSSSRKVFDVLKNDIVERKGEARISSILFQVTEEEAGIVSRFQLQADEEYQEAETSLLSDSISWSPGIDRVLVHARRKGEHAAG